MEMVWLWLWCRTAVEALIQPLAHELVYTTGTVLKRKEKKMCSCTVAMNNPKQKLGNYIIQDIIASKGIKYLGINLNKETEK